jgi:hypothetical protein
MQSGEISSSIMSLAEATARKPKASAQPSNPLSVLTLTSNESAAGKFLSTQAEALGLLPALNGTRSGTASMPVIVIFGAMMPARVDTNHFSCQQGNGADADRRWDPRIQDQVVRSPLSA